MARKARLAAAMIRDGLARLVDIAPPELTVYTEGNDWALVGEDFQAAIDDAVSDEPSLQPDDAELVEA